MPSPTVIGCGSWRSEELTASWSSVEESLVCFLSVQDLEQTYFVVTPVLFFNSSSPASCYSVLVEVKDNVQWSPGWKTIGMEANVSLFSNAY